MSLFSKPRGKHAHGAKNNSDESPQASGAESASVETGPLGEVASEDAAEDESASEASGDGKEASSGSGADESSDKAEKDDAGSPGNSDAEGDEAGETDGEVGDSDSENADDEENSEATADEEEADTSEAAVEDNAAAGFVAAGFGEIPSKKRRRGLKAFGITVGVLAVVALIVYIAGAVVFMGRFLPNTVIGDHDVSMKTDAEVVELLDGIASNYQLDVIGGGFAYRTTGEGLGLSIDSAGIVSSMHEDENAWRWPLLIFESNHDETRLLGVNFKPSTYEADVTAAVNTFNETATPPVNATIAYDEKNDKFIVKPEEAGTQLDAALVLAAMGNTIEQLETKLVLGEEHLIKPTVFSTDEKLIEAAELATGMVSADLSLVMGGQPVGEVTGDTLSSFITINENFEVVFKEDEMNAWVSSLAAGYNTVGVERTYTRADGKAVVVPAGGTYGWEIDTEALKNAVLEGIKAGAKSTIEVPCVDTAAVYNGVGQRDWGNRYLDVDISEQHVRFYGDDGAIIWEADCISGSPDGTHDTVPGTWYVNNKETPSKLIGYENGKKIYETTVTFWMPFEGNSIGFHDATWQPSFGGSMYANGYGSHGCVNLSYDAAHALYDIIQVGDVVVVHH